MLALVAGVFSAAMLRVSPLTTDLSAWYAADAMLAVAIVLGLAIYGFRTTLGNRRIWRDELVAG